MGPDRIKLNALLSAVTCVFCCILLSLIASKAYANRPLTIFDSAKEYFAIKYPVGWDVKPSSSGKQILFSGPLQSAGHKPTLHVTRFDTSVFIDEISLDLFKTSLEDRFRKSLGTMAGYVTTYQDLIDLNTRHKAMLFYGKFTMHGKQFMQAHMVVSTREFHVLVTYTDSASVFANTDAEPFKSMWAAMTSLKIQGRPVKQRFSYLAYLGLGFGLLAVLSLLVFIMKHDSRKKYQSFADEDLEDIPESELESLAQTRAKFKTIVPEEAEDSDDTWKISS